MAPSSSSHPRIEEHDAFSGIEPPGTRRKVDESSRLFDVFINHRGPDVKQTLALLLYNSLTELGIHAFLDSEEKELGDSFPSTIENAIHSAKVHIAIFSKGYVESPWCLAELVLMLQTKAKIIPLFYGVKPSALRYIEKGDYAKAFAEHEKKRRYMEKLKQWKDALQSVSLITGYEISGDFNISDRQDIVSGVEKEVHRKKSLHVATYPVGLDRLAEDFERKCRTNERAKEKSQIVGIFGMGGVGKTTLAKELFNRKHSQYGRACFLFNVREAYANNNFSSLQMKFLKDIFQIDLLNCQSTEEGKTHIADCIERSNHLSFLIVLDDIDGVHQLDALLVMEILKKSVESLVIVTTRDVGVLRNTGITAAYNIEGMDRGEARELFCWHAFGQPSPAKDYENLVDPFLNVCGGLPLSVQVLGSHVHGTDQNFWSLELHKVSKTLPRDIHRRLEISFNALEYEEQQIFMDIACFFVDELENVAIEVWEASGWSAKHALKTLKNKCLIQEIKEGFALRMHDHLRDLGREMANALSHPRRLWRPQDLLYLESKGFKYILTQTKGRCFHSFYEKSMDCRITYLLGESDVRVETSTFLLWLKLDYPDVQDKRQPCIPSWIPLQSLRCLIIRNMWVKTLWQSHVQAPNQLKELQMHNTCVKLFSDLSVISNSLEKITIVNCKNLKTMLEFSDFNKLTELRISDCRDLLKLNFVHLSCLEILELHNCSVQEISAENLSCLKKFVLHNCYSLKTLLGICELRKLVELDISLCPGLEKLGVVHLECLTNMILHKCHSLRTVSGISDLKKLRELHISGCSVFDQLRLVGLSNLQLIELDDSFKPACFELDGCRNLTTISGHLNLGNLLSINIHDCPKLELLPSLERANNLETVIIDGCLNLNSLVLSRCENLKRVIGKFDLEKLIIWDCPELEALSSLLGVTRLKTINISGCRKLNSLQLLKCLNLKQVCITDCPELEELKCSALQTNLKKIDIFRCGKVQGITLPITLVELVIEGCRELKTVAAIRSDSECLELNELSSIARLSSLKPNTSETCRKLQNTQGTDGGGKLNSIQLLKCLNLQQLCITDCPELEELKCSVLQTSLKKISIVRCGKMQSITLPIPLVELVIEGCRELKTVTAICNHTECLELNGLSSIARLSYLKSITSQASDKLQTIQGTDGGGMLKLHKCQDFKQVCISNCPELPCFALHETCLEKISIVRCGKMQRITLPTTLVELVIEGCRELKTVAVICNHSERPELSELSVARLSCLSIASETSDKIQGTDGGGKLTICNCGKLNTLQLFKFLNFKQVSIFDCPDLEDLPCFASQTFLEKTSIVKCGKLQNMTLPTNLVELVIEECRELKTVTVICDRSECLELQELSNVARLSRLKQITVQTCDKLQSIQGIHALHQLKRMQLLYCGNAAVPNYISMLKRMPLEIFVAGKAVNGARSILKPRLFFDSHVLLAKIGCPSNKSWQRVRAECNVVIYCALLVVSSSLKNRLSRSNSNWQRVPRGKWIFTTVTNDRYFGEKSRTTLNGLERDLMKRGMMKEGYKVGVKRGEEWKIPHVLHTIVKRLHDK